MKKKIASLTLLWGMLLFVGSGLVTGVAAQAAVQSFEVQFSVPLSTGGDFDYELVDSANALRTNVSQLRPVIAKLLDDMQAGTMPSHPTAEGEDSQNDPKTFYSRVASSFDKRGSGPVCTASMIGVIDVFFTGQIRNGHTELTLKSIDFTHCPPDNDMISFVLFSAHPDELGAYKVGKKSLKAYLESQKYETYVLSITVNGTRTFIEDMDNSPGSATKSTRATSVGFERNAQC